MLRIAWHVQEKGKLLKSWRILTLANRYQMPEYRHKIVGLLIPGALCRAISEDVYRLTAEDAGKIEMIRMLAGSRCDFDALDRLFDT